MFKRDAENRLAKLLNQFPVISITGPRQSGKSTLAKIAAPEYRYVTLENPNNREFAQEDPKGFLSTYSDKVIIDEAQRVPHLFNYMQEQVDAADKPGQYILSGSHDFLLMESITQSLAGRTALINLFPLSKKELSETEKAPQDINLWLLQGGFPRLHRYDIDPLEFYPPYIQTYLERDVRQQTNVGSLDDFKKFMKLCAGRIGNLLDIGNLATEAGVNAATAKRWLSILQASYAIILVPPYFNNFNKRLVKRPKLYFCDTGLACSLLGLRSKSDIAVSAFRGPLFENMVLMEYLKKECASGPKPEVWFWQETATNEVDFIVGSEANPQAIEVKSGATFDRKWFKSMKVFTELADIDENNRTVVYAGDETVKTSNGHLVSWKDW